MVMTMQFSGVKTPSRAVSSVRYLQSLPVFSQQLHFATSVAYSPRLCTNAKKLNCRGRVLRMRCEGGVVDVVERNQSGKQFFCENEKYFTCVMKFGGSSVASAERMREVSELILSFPEETSVIVLSAMGKTTNKLLLVQKVYSAPSVSFVFILLFVEQ